MKEYTDEELIRSYVVTQRNVYFEALYERYCDKVYRRCLQLTKDPVKAEDFTHDIFLRLIVRLGSFKEQAKFSTWLYSVTYNYCMDHLRSHKQKEVYVEEGYENFPDYTDSDDAEVAEMEANRLHKALDHLTSEEQSLLLMKYQDDLSIRDIASMLRLTESAVKMRLKRSKEKLRKYYLEGVLFWLALLLKLLTTFKWPFR
ncbi:RNA polymerase sigma factor [Nibrella saemangeumensis]|uniref:RNA polymerase sigma factor n=1 Tax=Nibrella saemangeumensis TaxID=1084526 RepID=A0ABP8NN46_9BACT